MLCNVVDSYMTHSVKDFIMFCGLEMMEYYVTCYVFRCNVRSCYVL